MRVRALLATGAAIAASIAIIPTAPATADATLTAAGIVSTQVPGLGTCTGAANIVLEQSGGDFVLNTTILGGTNAGQPFCAFVNFPLTMTNREQSRRQCLPTGSLGVGIVQGPASISQSGSTYTVRKEIQDCLGNIITHTQTFTVGGATVEYEFDLSQNGGTVIRSTASLVKGVSL